MPKRILGKTGLSVPAISFGASELGHHRRSLNECERLLNGVLDLGIALIDTAASYENSEEHIGRAIGHRREEFILVTKCGRAPGPGEPKAWSPKLIRRHAEQSVKRLRTDHLDVLLLHTCKEKHLRNDDMIAALLKCKADGLTRFVGYSGDNAPLRAAIAMDVFDCVETSISLCDQQVLDAGLPEARRAGLGALAKRSLANAAWRDPAEFSDFYRHYARDYIERLRIMNFTPESLGFDGSWIELALRFTLFQPGVHTAIVGGENIDHIKTNIAIAAQGPLPEPVERKVRDAWRRCDDGGWVGRG